MSIDIVITDIYDNNTEYVITRDLRKGLVVDNNVPGGHDTVQFDIPCALATSWMTQYGKWPSLGSRLEVRDNGVPFWGGRYCKPQLRVEKRALVKIHLNAQGYYKSAEDDRFDTRVVYGIGDTGVQIGDDKTNCTDIVDGISHAITQLCPFVVVPAITPSGINITMDTQAFAGASAEEVANFFAALTSYLATPMVWQILINPSTGLMDFTFTTMETAEYYYDDGLTSWDAEYDIERIMNVATVEYGNNQRWTEPFDTSGPGSLSGPLAYASEPPGTGTDIIRRKYVNAAEQYTGFDDIKALAAAYVSRFNNLKASGTIEVREALRRSGVGVVPVGIHLLMPGHVIKLDLPPDYPVVSDTSRYISHTSWSEDSCVTTLTVGDATGLYADMRRLVMLPQKFTMSMSQGDIVQPLRNANEAPTIGTIYPGTEYDNVGGHVVVRTVMPMAAMTTSGASVGANNKDFGDHGGQILPGNLPDNFSEILVPIRTADGSAIPVDAVNPVITLPIAKEYKLDTWRTATVQAGAITFVVKKNGVTMATAAQAAGNSGTGSFGLTTLAPGDVLTVFVTANAGGIANGTVNVSGNKHWSLFPTYPGKP